VAQFFVFSNLFLVAPIQKVINARSREGLRASKEILSNEIGVVFAVENRATADFWKQPVAGHVTDELEILYFGPDFGEAEFITGGRRRLDGVQTFWTGLNEHRIAAVND